MSDENINRLVGQPGKIEPGQLEVVLPPGTLHYVPPVEGADPSGTEATKTAKALGNLGLIYSGAVPQSGEKLANDSPHRPLEIVAADENGKPVLLRPASRDDEGKVTFKVSTDTVKDGDGRVITDAAGNPVEVPRRPLMNKPNAKLFHNQPTTASRRAETHMVHAAHIRDEGFMVARGQYLITKDYTTPTRLGLVSPEPTAHDLNKEAHRLATTRPGVKIEDLKEEVRLAAEARRKTEVENLKVEQYDSAGKLTRPDPNNPNLRSFHQLSHPEKLRLFLATNPDRMDARVAREAIRVYEKGARKGAKYDAIVQNHGHHRVLHKPWTWLQGGHGHGHEDHEPVERQLPTLQEARREAKKANKVLFSTAVKPALDFYHDYMESNEDPDAMDAIATQQTGVPALGRAIAAGAEVKRVREIRNLEKAWEANRQAVLDANPSRKERKTLSAIQAAIVAADIGKINKLLGKYDMTAELRDAVTASYRLTTGRKKARLTRQHP